MIRRILIFLFIGFILCFAAIWLLNGGFSRTKTIIETSPDPLAYLLGLSTTSDSFFTLPGQADMIPALPTTDINTTSDTGSLDYESAQTRLEELQHEYQDLRTEYDTSGPGYTH